MSLGLLCLKLDPETERMAQELRDISDVGSEARRGDSRAVTPRERKTKITSFLYDVLQTAIVERYQKLKDVTVTPIRDGKTMAAEHGDQADGFF